MRPVRELSLRAGSGIKLFPARASCRWPVLLNVLRSPFDKSFFGVHYSRHDIWISMTARPSKQGMQNLTLEEQVVRVRRLSIGSVFLKLCRVLLSRSVDDHPYLVSTASRGTSLGLRAGLQFAIRSTLRVCRELTRLRSHLPVGSPARLVKTRMGGGVLLLLH